MDRDLPARADDRRRIGLFDDCRTGDPGVNAHTITIVNFHALWSRRVSEQHRTMPFQALAHIGCQSVSLECFLMVIPIKSSQIDDPGGRVHGVAVNAVMLALEILIKPFQRIRVIRVDRDFQMMGLPYVTAVGQMMDVSV